MTATAPRTTPQHQMLLAAARHLARRLNDMHTHHLEDLRAFARHTGVPLSHHKIDLALNLTLAGYTATQIGRRR